MLLPHERIEALERLCQAQQEFIVDLAARIAILERTNKIRDAEEKRIFERRVFKPTCDGIDIDMMRLMQREWD